VLSGLRWRALDEAWDHNLGNCTQDNLTRMMQFLDADDTRTGTGWGGWPATEAEYLRATLRPDGGRFAWGASDRFDGSGPSYLADLAVRGTSDDLGRRIAWKGHAPGSYGTITRRDYLDVLWREADEDVDTFVGDVRAAFATNGATASA